MDLFLEQGGTYLGVFLALLATALGMPFPEELPVLLGGAFIGAGKAQAIYMVPMLIVGVLLGDLFLYTIGRIWGPRLVELPLVKKLLTPEKLASITENFQKYGIKILLFARLTPGIRAPIFMTAGITKLPVSRFLLADCIYALPGVAILTFLGYVLADSIEELRKRISEVKSWLFLAVFAGLTIYFVYRVFRKPVVTGNPQEVPTIMEPVSTTITKVAEPLLHTKEEDHSQPVKESRVNEPGEERL